MGDVLVDQDEVLDLVDEQDRVIGQATRGEVLERDLHNFRVVNAFLRNSKGEIWVPLRGPNKRQFPNCLDVSCGGHVSSGEDYETSFRRELEEELRIDLDDVSWSVIGRYTPHEHGVSAFMVVYEILYDKTPDFNREDFVSSRWLAPDVFIRDLESGVPQKGDLLKLVRWCYGASA